MSNVDMCEHDWPGSGCKECRAEAMARKITAPSGTPAMPVKAYYHEAPNEYGGFNKSVGLEVRKAFADAPLVLEADAMTRVACLEGEIAKRDEELAACRVAVENCEVFRARIAELEADRDRIKTIADNYSALNMDAQAELAAIKAQEPVQVDCVAVMRADGDGGLEVEWLLEGGTAELMSGMYLCCVGGGTLLFEEGSGHLYAAPVSEAEAQGDAWAPSVNDYDHSIHSNPDAREWADFFVATFPGLADKHDLMIGWFANAMMAMHDHLARKAQGVVMPERDSFMAGVKAASDKVKAIVEDYDQRHGSTDPDTGTREYPGNGEEWVCCMLELIEDFTVIVAPSSLAAAPVSEAKAQGEYGEAYQGAREDLAIWKRRALEAEEKVLQQEQIIDHLTSEAQGESRFGEPVVTPDAPCVPDGYVLADKKALGTVLQALVNAPHHIRELQVTRQPVELFSDNPINVLIANYEAPAAPEAPAADAGLVAVEWAKDAEEWGPALNKAGWLFLSELNEDPQKSALIFNNTKGPLRAAIMKYAEIVTAHRAKGVV